MHKSRRLKLVRVTEAYTDPDSPGVLRNTVVSHFDPVNLYSLNIYLSKLNCPMLSRL